MTHLVALPVVLPLMIAAVQLVAAPRMALQRALALATGVALVVIAALLVGTSADGAYGVYALGAWPAPFGIVLVLDRMSALMLMVTALLALGVIAAAVRGWDERGRYFHAFFQFQLAGINGAFLTGDLFNLFVFFEVLLIASYCLLLHGLGAERLRAGLRYVVINLSASALFLVGVAVLYALTGTLNMADLGVRVAELPSSDVPLARAAGLMLFVVFGVKAALFPLYFWLPSAYAAASAPVAALFAIMSKVGMYAILRVHPLVFGEHAAGASLTDAPLMALGIATLVLASIGTLAADRIASVVAYFTIMSAGNTLIAVAVFGEQGFSAALYYMAHSSFALGALFLLAGLIGAQRGALGDRLAPGPALLQPAVLGVLLLLGAVSIAGLPPLSGFIGKLLILQSVRGEAMLWAWGAILVTSLLAIVCWTRVGSLVVWNNVPAARPGARIAAAELAPVAFLAACSVALAAFAGPVQRFTDAAATQLATPSGYVKAVLAAAPEPRRRTMPR